MKSQDWDSSIKKGNAEPDTIDTSSSQSVIYCDARRGVYPVQVDEGGDEEVLKHHRHNELSWYQPLSTNQLENVVSLPH